MPRHLRNLPRRELAVDFLGERLAALGKALDLLRDVHRRIVLDEAQLLDAVLQLRHRLLEIQESCFHISILREPGRASARGTRWPPSATAATFRRAASSF